MCSAMMIDINNFLPYGSSLMKEPRGFLGGNVMFEDDEWLILMLEFPIPPKTIWFMLCNDTLYDLNK